MELYNNYWETLSIMGVIVFLFLRGEIKKTKPYCLSGKDNTMASKTGTYWREGSSSITWLRYG
jgi:hypothetical protein